jgi:hypothetical protein
MNTDPKLLSLPKIFSPNSPRLKLVESQGKSVPISFYQMTQNTNMAWDNLVLCQAVTVPCYIFALVLQMSFHVV